MSKAANLAAVGLRQWKTVTDQTLTAVSNGLTVALPPEFEQFRMTLDMRLNPAATGGDPYPSMLVSSNNGSSYYQGAADYYYEGGYTTGGTYVPVGTSASLRLLLALRATIANPQLGVVVEATFRNQTGRRLWGRSNFTGYGGAGSGWSEGQLLVSCAYATKMTHMIVGPGDITNGMGIGTRLIVEGI